MVVSPHLSHILAGLSALVLGIAACQPAATPASPIAATAQPAPPQELRVGLALILPNLDAHVTTGAYAGTKLTIFDTVTRTDSKGNVVPWLATSWKTISPTVWELQLRENVKFSNGEPMDARAIKFNIDRILDPATKSPIAGRISLVTGAEVVNPLTVRILTKQPDAILPARMATVLVVPPDEVTKIGAVQFGLKPVGTGPFKLLEYVQDSRLVLERSPESWRKSNIQKLTFLSLPQPSTRVAALRNGDVQMIIDPPLDQITAIERDGFVIASVPAAIVYVEDLDQITEDSPMRDKRVRQALNYAVDKETMVKQIFNRRARVADGQIMGQAGFGYDPTLKAYPYDPAKAKQLLAEAGYPNGFTIKMESAAAHPAGMTLAVQGNLRDIGVNAELTVLEQSVWVEHFYGRQKRSPVFQAQPAYHPAMDADFTLQWYVCNSQKKVACNPEFDKLYASSTSELDPQRRLALLKQMHAMVREDALVLYLVEPHFSWAMNKTVQGYEPRSDDQPVYETISLTR